MPTRKIADLPQPCRDPDHEPPLFQSLERGVYEHVCPGCSQRTTFTVDPPSMRGVDEWAHYLDKNRRRPDPI